MDKIELSSGINRQLYDKLARRLYWQLYWQFRLKLDRQLGEDLNVTK